MQKTEFEKPEQYRALNSLVIAAPIDKDEISAAGIVLADGNRETVPYRALVLACPTQLLRDGLLPGDTVLYAAQTRSTLTIKFKPTIQAKELVAIPPACIVTYVAASVETRKQAIKDLAELYETELLSLLKGLGNLEIKEIQNIWNY